MKKMFAAAAAGLFALAGTASADALQDAREANICDVTAAEYLADGRLKVVCVPGTVNPAYAGQVAQPVLGGTQLNPGAAAAIGGLALVLILSGDDDSSTTTTTTTSGGS